MWLHSPFTILTAIIVAVIVKCNKKSPSFNVDILQQQNQVKNYSFTESADNMGRCGGIISGENGYISYKLGEAIQARERCVWQLRNKMGSGFELLPKFLGFKDFGNKAGLIITPLKFNKVEKSILHYKSFMRNQSVESIVVNDTSKPMAISGHKIILTFWSGEDVSEYDSIYGFKLKFRIIRNKNATVKDSIAQYSESLIVYPGEETLLFPNRRVYLYGSYGEELHELSTFIFVPENNFEGKEMTLGYNKLANSTPYWQCEHQRVNKYKFWLGHDGATPKYESRFPICDGTAFSTEYGWDVVLWVVHSVLKIDDPRRRFEYYWEPLM